MKYPKVYDLKNLIMLSMDPDVQANINGKWVPARPLGYPSFTQRVRAAWLVFTGKADAVKWPGDQ